ETGIDHGTALVHTPAQRRQNALDDAQHVCVVLKLDVAEHDLAPALDVNLVGTVDHYFGDAIVVQQRLDRAETENVGHDPVEEILAVCTAQHQTALSDGAGEERLDDL